PAKTPGHRMMGGFRCNFGTTEKGKNRFLVPKRHQMKHLEFLILLLGTRGSEVQLEPFSRRLSLLRNPALRESSLPDQSFKKRSVCPRFIPRPTLLDSFRC